jgi:hypothetical protein
LYLIPVQMVDNLCNMFMPMSWVAVASPGHQAN